jgi:hypothetical protein
MILDDFKALALNTARNRYFGRSSGLYLIQTAREMKQQHDGPNVRQPPPTRRPQFWHSPVGGPSVSLVELLMLLYFQWETQPTPPPPVYEFPPQDLLNSLVSVYFKRINIVMCLLHRPTFERSIAAGLHLIDPGFGAVVLAVCALASRCVSSFVGFKTIIHR